MLGILYFLYGLLLFLVGGAIFSFVNVVAYRVPRHLPLVKDRSFCPACGHPIGALDMVPVLSWLWLRGRCRSCKGSISPRYPLVEALGGGMGLLCAARFGASAGLWSYSAQALLALLFLATLTAVALVDADTQEIPDGFVLVLLACGLTAFWAFPALGWGSRLIGAVCISLPMLLVALLVPGGFGGGDIKLMAAVGLFLGWRLCLVAMLLGILTGGFYGIWLLASKRKGRKEQFAFGPFLCAGIAVSLFWGEALIEWYLHFL